MEGSGYPVLLEWTPCNLGGQRPWFPCPVSVCGRRIAVLYGGRIYACRHCHELANICQVDHLADRMARSIDKIRDRMGWGIGILNGIGPKPKGMHLQTYWRLIAEHDSLVKAAVGWLRQMGSFGG